MRRLICSLLATLVLLSNLSIIAFAHETPDLVNGTITFNMRYNGKNLNGGSLSIFRVGNVEENDGNYYFVSLPGLPETKIAINETDNPQLAVELKEIALNKANDLSEQKVAIKDGIAEFTDVEPGLYVVIQREATSGYIAMNPFLISMPHCDEDGHYTNTIEASPKVSIEKKPDKPSKPKDPTPSKPQDPPKDPAPQKPKDPTLPQTGQLNWPVPVLAVAGLILFAVGWLLRFGRRGETYES